MIEGFFNAHLLSECAGYAPLLISIFAMQLKRPIISLHLLGTGSALMGLHVLLLGEVAFAIMFVNAFRNFCGATLSQENLKYMIFLCLTASFALTIPQIQSLIDLIPLIAAVLISMGTLTRDKPAFFRQLWLAGQAAWFLYGVCVSSFPIVLSSSLMSISIITSVIRYDLLQVSPAK